VQWRPCAILSGVQQMVSPAARRLRLGVEVRALREQADLTGLDLAREAGVDRTALSRIEHGERRPLDLILKILDKLLPDDAVRYAELVRVARDGINRGWWERPEYAGMGERQARTADLECGIVLGRLYQNVLPPGLLQAESYARYRAEVAVREGAQLDIEGTVRGRKRRQEVLKDPGVRLDVILEPQAIDREYAPGKVVHEQLMHLYDVATHNSSVSIRVLPVRAKFDTGYAPRSPFEIFSYRDPGDMTLVSVDTVDADKLITSPAEAARYVQLHTQMTRAALSKTVSARMIYEAASNAAGS